MSEWSAWALSMCEFYFKGTLALHLQMFRWNSFHETKRIGIYSLQIFPFFFSVSFDCLFCTTFLSRNFPQSDLPERKPENPNDIWFSQNQSIVNTLCDDRFRIDFRNVHFVCSHFIVSKNIHFYCAHIPHTNTSMRNRSIPIDSFSSFDEHMRCASLSQPRVRPYATVFAISFSFHLLELPHTHKRNLCLHAPHATRAQRSCSAECRRTNRSVCRRVVSSSMCRCRQMYRAIPTEKKQNAHTRHSFVRCVCVSFCVRVSVHCADDESNTPTVLVVCKLLWSEWVQNANNNKQDTNM